MDANTYIKSVVDKYSFVPTPAHKQSVLGVVLALNTWAGPNLVTPIVYSGSIAKGTAIHGVNDFDLFISLRSTLATTVLGSLYESLFAYATKQRWQPRKQNVSIGISTADLRIDLVPARQQQGYQHWHSLWRNKARTWTQTNVALHIDTVKNSGRLDEIKAIKIWRSQHKLEFPSFYLELAVLRALSGHRIGNLSDNVYTALEFLADDFLDARLEDPANTNNVISDDLTVSEKRLIADAAKESVRRPKWEEIIW